MGQHEVADHVAVLDELKKRWEWIDGTRVGIVGKSWGGYVTVRAMLTAADTYVAGCAHAPVGDHHDHQGHLAHMIMGFPWRNPDGYRLGSSLPLARCLSGKLLITHGTSDLGATLSATMKLSDAFIKAGRAFDLFVFPEETHSPSGHAGKYLDGLTARYLVRHLSPDGVTEADIPLG
jgi:dipeptidyl-peptidase-4